MHFTLPGQVSELSSESASTGIVSPLLTDISSFKVEMEARGFNLFGADDLQTKALNQAIKDLNVLANTTQVQFEALADRLMRFFVKEEAVDYKAAKFYLDQTLNDFAKDHPAVMSGGAYSCFSIPQAESVFTGFESKTQLERNIKSLMKIMAEAMNRCAEQVHTTHHSPAHAYGVMSAVMYLASRTPASSGTILLMGILGLLHDSIFLRERVRDEERSAELILAALAPFNKSLSERQSTLLHAFVRFVIVGGTLPLFLMDQTKKMQMKTLWELVLPFYSRPGLVQHWFNYARMISDGDVQSSLIIGLLRQVPVHAGALSHPALVELDKVIETYLDDSNVKKEIEQLNQSVAAQNSHLIALGKPAVEGLSMEDARLEILSKLGQSIRMVAEIKALGQSVEALDPTQLKISAYLREGVPPEFTREDIDYIIKKFVGEQGFAGFNERGLVDEEMLEDAEAATHAVAAAGGPSRRASLSKREYSWNVTSWKWHKEIYARINAILSNPDQLETAQALLLNILDNGRVPYGAGVDMAQLLNIHLGLEPMSVRKSSPSEASSDVSAPLEAAPRHGGGCWSFLWHRKTNKIKPLEAFTLTQ